MRKILDIHITNFVKPPAPPKIINVIISIYDGVEFIEECLDSIAAQTLKPDKILLGVDGCKKSLNKVLQIAHKYDNLKLYYAKKNGGVYKMFNALIYKVPDNEYIQFFGADDVMHEDMLERISAGNKYAISRHVGVLFINAGEIKKVGGYRNWKCGADADMIYRLRLYYNYHEKIYPLLFNRRMHDKQLTAAKETGNGSALRNKYSKITEDNYKSDKPVTYIKPIKSKIEML